MGSLMTTHNKDWDLSHQMHFYLTAQQEIDFSEKHDSIHKCRLSISADILSMCDPRGSTCRTLRTDIHLNKIESSELDKGQYLKRERRHCPRYQIQRNQFISLSCYTFFTLSNGELTPLLSFSWAGAISCFHRVSKEIALSVDADALQTLPILVIRKLDFPFSKSAETSRIAIITQQDTVMFFTVLLVMKSHIT